MPPVDPYQGTDLGNHDPEDFGILETSTLQGSRLRQPLELLL